MTMYRPSFVLALPLTVMMLLSPLTRAADTPAPAPRSSASQTTTSLDKDGVYKSVEERRLLLALRQERQNLGKEREQLARRKKDLKRLEAEVDKKLAKLAATRRKIEELLKEKDARELKRIKDLAKMYAKMSPDKAAAVFSDLDTKLVVSIMTQMKAKSAARILNNMDRDKAAKITQSFSTLP